MKLRINNLDLGYTIDSYGMFTGESVDESEAEYYRDIYGIDTEYAEFDYDHVGIVKALAENSIDILESELKGDIVKSITFEKSTSPQFYNYTTDSYIAVWDINHNKLIDYILANKKEYEKFFEAEWREVWADESKSDVVAMLDFYTRSEFPIDDYNSHMWEREFEVYFKNMEPTKGFQKLIDGKEVTK